MSKSLKESADRLEASRTVPQIYRFKGENLKPMFEEIAEAGPENVELWVYPGLDDDGSPEAWFKVVHRDAQGVLQPDNGGGTYNVSETCPPICCPPICNGG